MNGKHPAKSGLRFEASKPVDVSTEPSRPTDQCAPAETGDDIVLTAADREFLDYIADVAIELYFARYGAK